MKMKAHLTALCMSLAFAATAAADPIAGRVSRVHDGDTFTLDNGTKIRVFGIDAPELKQQCKTQAGICEPCGQISKAALSGLIFGKQVSCRQRGKSYARIVGECVVEGVQIGPWMLSHGQAIAYEHYLKASDRFAYMGAQEGAKRANVGIWADTFIPMEDWRHHGERLECERRS
jgi:endonuclease YncB( thermonuclease family)